MKAALVLLVFGVCVALSVGLKNCWINKDDCEEDECCVKVINIMGKCKKLKEEDESCASHPVKQPLKDHVYWGECPCKDGLKCVKKDGLIGHIRGTCQAGSGETTDGTGGEEE